MIMAYVICTACNKGASDPIPVISTKAVTDVTMSSAKSGGIIISDGGEAIIEYGVCWNTSGNPNSTDLFTIGTSGSSQFDSNIMDLAANTTYHLRAYASNSAGTGYGEELIFKTDVDPDASGNGVVDIDGNVYNIVEIGSQVWMRENLNTTKYNNGKEILHVINHSSWYYCTQGAYCDWGNTGTYSNTYGRLYNWYAAANNNICPTGWHVPSREEWETLRNNSGGEIAAGGILKEMGTEHWLEPNRDATNQYGFTALPAGYRASYENRFDPIGISANFWTSTEFSDVGAWFYGMYFSFGSLGTNSNLKSEGLSIRCIKN